MKLHDIPIKTNGIDQSYTQTDLKRSELKFGMAHPKIKGLFYFNWDKRKPYPQRWRTKEAIDKERARQKRSAHKRRQQPDWHKKNRERNREARIKYPERYRAYNRKSTLKRKLTGKAQEYRSRPEVRMRTNQRQNEKYAQDREIRRKQGRDSYQRRKDKIREQRQTPYNRLVDALRTRVYYAIKRKVEPTVHTLELVGCTKEVLFNHIENQFTDGMTWENYGSTWHLDHIKPCAAFDLNLTEQQKKCFNYKNLRPLTARENKSKGAKYQGKDYRNL